jgi:hypothetical protein
MFVRSPERGSLMHRLRCILQTVDKEYRRNGGEWNVLTLSDAHHDALSVSLE